jgi:hypothetical protein
MSPEDREFLTEARRHLVGLVGLIERYAGIEPVCRKCAGCNVCESMHRKTNDVAYTSRESSRSAGRVSAN